MAVSSFLRLRPQCLDQNPEELAVLTVGILELLVIHALREAGLLPVSVQHGLYTSALIEHVSQPTCRPAQPIGSEILKEELTLRDWALVKGGIRLAVLLLID